MQAVHVMLITKVSLTEPTMFAERYTENSIVINFVRTCHVNVDNKDSRGIFVF